MNTKQTTIALVSGILCWIVSPLTFAQDTVTEPTATAPETTPAPEIAPAPETAPAPILIVPEVAKGTYPISEVDRPLALPRLMLRPEIDLGLVFRHHGDTTTYVGIDLAASFGVIDHLEVGFGLANTPMSEQHINRFPLSYTPNPHAGDLPLYGLYEWGNFLEGKIRSAARLTASIPIGKDYYLDGSDHDHILGQFWMLADMPTKFKLHKMVALVGGIGMGFMAGEDNVSAFLLNIDMGAVVAPIEPLAFRLTLGFHIQARQYSDTLIPLMLRIQYTLLGNLDLFTDMGFPNLNKDHGNWFQLLAGACYRFQF